MKRSNRVALDSEIRYSNQYKQWYFYTTKGSRVYLKTEIKQLKH